ncbi:SDR family oxidoreductase [Rhizobium sp.]|jgi:3-dehydrosphinganine reductase|uniref:SDR family oxidoreductase n=1 Tax=Rhizobium sp. TaxID=391 RepID=UPI000E847C31|nr:translocation protein [Rhizobium sp.]
MVHTLITGGSSGIGLKIAQLLVQRGENVSLLARNNAKLEDAKRLLLRESHGSHVRTIPVDVTDFQAMKDAVASCVKAQGAIDNLISSAGMIIPQSFLLQTHEDFDIQIKTNLIGVANSIRAIYPDMIAARRGKIMIISSGAALLGIPGFGAYCASKYGLRGLATSLRIEARPKGVSISICFPPDTDTPQFRTEIAQRNEETNIFLGPPKPWQVDKVANRILKGMDAREDEIFFGFGMTLLNHFGAFIRPAIEKAYERRNRKKSHISR